MRMSRKLGMGGGLRGPAYIKVGGGSMYRYCIYETKEGGNACTYWQKINYGSQAYFGEKKGGIVGNYGDVVGGYEFNCAYTPFKFPENIRVKKVSVDLNIFDGGSGNQIHYGWALCHDSSGTNLYINKNPGQASSIIGQGCSGGGNFAANGNAFNINLLKEFSFEEAVGTENFQNHSLYLFIWPTGNQEGVAHINSATLTYYYY